MARLDPHSYADLAQGRCTHVEWTIHVDFEALLQGDAAMAREVFGASKAGYHPIERAGLEALLVE